MLNRSNIVPPLPAPIKALYSVGEIANATKTVIFGIFTLFFYTSVMGLPGTLVGAASALGVLWDAMVDPVIGQRSDAHVGRWGRRHGFMLLGALTMGPAFWAFFSPPPGASHAVLFGWLLVTTLLVRTATSLFSVPFYALGAELARDYGARTNLAGLRGAVALAGTLLTTVLTFTLFFPDTATGGDPKLMYGGYPRMGAWLGLVMTAAALVATFATLRWRSVGGEPTTRAATTWRALFGTLRHPSFGPLWTSFALYYIALVVNGTLAIHYTTYYARITASADLALFQVAFYVAGITGVALWLWAARVIDKHWLYIGSAVALAALMLGGVTLFGAGTLFGTGNTPVYALARGVAGLFGSILWFVPAAMVADVADDDALRTGQRREGAFFGMLSFGQQFATGVALVGTGIAIDRWAGLTEGQTVQGAQTVWRIGVLWGWIPAALLVVAAVIGTRYRLSRRAVADIQRTLDERTPHAPTAANERSVIHTSDRDGATAEA